MSLATIWAILRETGTQFWNRKGPRLGAAIAFYAALSLSPLLVVVIAIAGFIYGEAAARGEIALQLRDTVGEQGAQAIQSILAAQHSNQRGVLMTVVGVVTLLVGASGVFAELQDALDSIWHVKRNLSSGITGAIRDRLLSFTFVFGIAILLLASLIISAVLSALNSWIADWLSFSGTLLQIGNQVVSFAFAALLFAMIFKVLPHAKPFWRDVWVGALITAGLFTLGKYLIGLYLAQAVPGSAYGAAGSFVVLLIWVYYSAQILLFGAELTKVYARRVGSGLLRANSIGAQAKLEQPQVTA